MGDRKNKRTWCDDVRKKNTGGGDIKRGMSGKTEYMSNTPHWSLERNGRLEIDQEIARKKN